MFIAEALTLHLSSVRSEISVLRSYEARQANHHGCYKHLALTEPDRTVLIERSSVFVQMFLQFDRTFRSSALVADAGRKLKLEL